MAATVQNRYTAVLSPLKMEVIRIKDSSNIANFSTYTTLQNPQHVTYLILNGFMNQGGIDISLSGKTVSGTFTSVGVSDLIVLVFGQ